MSYALLTTLGNVAFSAIGGSVSTLLTRIWDVSNATIAAQHFGGLWRLSLLTSFIQPMGLFLIFLLPRSVEEMTTTQKSDQRSAWGGALFLAFIAGAWLLSFITTFVTLGE
jgi:hypothetical protein